MLRLGGASDRGRGSGRLGRRRARWPVARCTRPTLMCLSCPRWRKVCKSS